MPFRQVFVVYEAGTLTIVPEQIELKTADELTVWNFLNLPQHSMPSVVFEAQSDGTGFTGPFSDLVGRAERVIGVGLSEAPPEPPSTYQYRVVIQRVDTKPVRSKLHTLTDNRHRVSTGTVVQVFRDESGLHVEPEAITTFSGAPLSWDFAPALGYSPEQEFRPSITFNDPQNSLGPFPDLTCARTKVQGQVFSGAGGRFRYVAALVPVQEDNGGIITPAVGVDPIVDDAGEPP